jgi:hypothetical protein
MKVKPVKTYKAKCFSSEFLRSFHDDQLCSLSVTKKSYCSNSIKFIPRKIASNKWHIQFKRIITITGPNIPRL